MNFGIGDGAYEKKLNLDSHAGEPPMGLVSV